MRISLVTRDSRFYDMLVRLKKFQGVNGVIRTSDAGRENKLMRPKSTVTIGLVGFGVVGGGVVELLKRHRADIAARVGARVKLKWVCSRRRKTDPLLLNNSILQTPNWRDVVNDPEVDCVVELMGGTEPARSLVIAAFRTASMW